MFRKSPLGSHPLERIATEAGRQCGGWAGYSPWQSQLDVCLTAGAHHQPCWTSYRRSSLVRSLCDYSPSWLHVKQKICPNESTVLVCSGCYSKVSQTRWLKNNRISQLWRPGSLWTKHLPKSQLPNTITLGLGFNIYIWGKHEYSGYSTSQFIILKEIINHSAFRNTKLRDGLLCSWRDWNRG